MKKIYCKTNIIFFLALLSFVSNSQNPCAGSPGSNTVVPINHTVCAGSAATMSLLNTYPNTSGLTYQWQFSTISQVGPFTTIFGANSNTYTSVPLNGTMYFNVIITCANSSVSISVPHVVNVVSCAPPCSGTPGPTTILPLTHTLCAGDVASMSLSTTYTDTGITYQWGSSPLSTGPFTAITGATLSTYTSTPLNSTTYYNIVITCTNSNQTYTTSHAVSVVTCTYCSGTPGPNTVVPVSQTICIGTTASMSLANTYSVSGITYQWQSSTVSAVGPFSNVIGANSNTYTTLPLNMTTYYNVVITCTNSGMTISVPHMVTVLSCTSPCTGVPASNTIVPATHTICSGDVATMNLANQYLFAGYSFRWESSTVTSGPYTAIPGATLNSYTSPPLNATMFYSLVVTCTNSGLIFTTTHSVSVITCSYCSGTPGANTVIPVNHTVCIGNPALMSLANNYTASGISYQWQASPTASTGPFTNILGATSNTYSSPSLTTTSYYNVVITCGNSALTLSLPHVVTVLNCTNNPVSLSELNSGVNGFLLYPNPGSGEVSLSSSEYEIKQMIMSDVTGKIMMSLTVSGKEIKFNIKELPKGIYSVKIIHQQGVKVLKVLKE